MSALQAGLAPSNLPAPNGDGVRREALPCPRLPRTDAKSTSYGRLYTVKGSFPSELECHVKMFLEEERLDEEVEQNLVENTFIKFFFGGQDPNEKFEKRRYWALAALIKSKGGVVAAEEIAPFLDPPRPCARMSCRGLYSDEAFVGPALTKLGGSPFVSDTGHMFYSFPYLANTDSWVTPLSVEATRTESPKPPSVVYEAQWPSNLKEGWRDAAVCNSSVCAVANVFYRMVFAIASEDSNFRWSDWSGWFRVLSLYNTASIGFLVIPWIRWMSRYFRNEGIRKRNAVRRNAELLLSLDLLASKLAEARELGRSQQQELAAVQPVSRCKVDELQD